MTTVSVLTQIRRNVMEQSVTTAIALARTSSPELPTSSESCEKKLVCLRQSFPSFESFATRYCPDRQVDFAVNEKNTIMSDYSTLDMLNMAYGKRSSAEWLTIHLAELNIFSGSKQMDNEQTKSLSKILA